MSKTSQDLQYLAASGAWDITSGSRPVIATAIHAGHDLRSEVAALVALDDSARRREEDPWTDEWTTIADNRIVVHCSRFEFDLNRPRASAVYQSPADAWGLDLWTVPPPLQLVERSLATYDGFYRALAGVIDPLIARWERLLILDLHSYNHRRQGPDGPPASASANPEINVGTGTMTDRGRWASVIDGFINGMRGFDFDGRSLDVRENIKFQGGQMARWLHNRYPESVCVLSVEVKKFFMDEWSGIPDPEVIGLIGAALTTTVRELEAMFTTDQQGIHADI